MIFIIRYAENKLEKSQKWLWKLGEERFTRMINPVLIQKMDEKSSLKILLDRQIA